MLESKENDVKEKNTLISIKKQQIRNASLTWLTVILILGILAIAAYTGITMYQTYTESKKMEMALEYAKDNNCMVKIRASNGGSCAVNVNAGNAQAGFNLMQGNAYSIILYPRNYQKEYFQVAPDSPIISVNSIPGEVQAVY